MWTWACATPTTTAPDRPPTARSRSNGGPYRTCWCGALRRKYSAHPTSNDPCVGLTAEELAQHSAACQNVPPNWSGNDIAQVNTYYSGSNVVNGGLKPEHGKSIDFGLVYDPSWLPGLNASLDFWHIYLYDTLVPISGITVVNACFNNNASPFCPFIHRQDETTQ